ncbi:MAG: type ISP restriction/modification enzyme [Parabacteroides distasonis]
MLPDLELIGKSQCFLSTGTKKTEQAANLVLFDTESSDDYIRRDGITDWILKESVPVSEMRKITKETIFYYVYGLLHSRNTGSLCGHLKKSLPYRS